MATTDRCAVAVIAYDVQYPEPLELRPRPIGAPFATALVLVMRRLRRLSHRSTSRCGRRARRPTAATVPALEALRANTPAARSLPLLEAMAREAAAEVVLPYLPEMELGLIVVPSRQSMAPHLSDSVRSADDDARPQPNRRADTSCRHHVPAGPGGAWDATSIRCRTARHRRGGQSAAAGGGSIGAVCAVEFAAQAMAVHGRLAGEAERAADAGHSCERARYAAWHAHDLDGSPATSSSRLRC